MGKKEWLNFIHGLVKETLPNSEFLIPYIDKNFQECTYPSVFVYKLSKEIETLRKNNAVNNIINPDQFLESIVSGSKTKRLSV